MFSATISKIVNELGRDTLHATPSIDEAQKIKLYNIVIKHKKKHFWQADYRLEPLASSIETLLKTSDSKSPDTLQSITRKRELGDYTFQVSTNAKGLLGVELCANGVDIDGNDTSTRSINTAKLEKVYVTEYELEKALHKRYIDFDNCIVKRMKKKSHEVLCVITGVVYPVSDLKIAKQSTLSEDGKIKTNVKKEIVDIDVEEKGSKKNSETLDIVAKTNLAYNVVELKIHPDGTIGVCMTENDKGGFDVVDLCSKGSEKTLFYPPEEVAAGKNKKELTDSLVDCIRYSALFEWLVHWLHVIHSHEDEKLPWDDKFWSFIGDDGFNAASRFFKLINVNFKYGEETSVDGLDQHMLGCALYYLELMSFLSNDEIAAITDCSSTRHVVSSFLKVFSCSLMKKDIGKDIVVPLLEYDWALKLLFCLGYDLKNVKKDSTIKSPKESFKAIEAVGKILYGLFILPLEVNK
ncbi:uncharacterized protein LOC115232596 [Octopus sinensis]|uniref:Uncharacterized protein LOC115232596 n=1 Tax=Octopus sinensis TaxID=2607531 RepID=A0A6P7U7R9_9MOLL|nr:uncharacterized protein LOC115232596 [Octopus sinensis]